MYHNLLAAASDVTRDVASLLGDDDSVLALVYAQTVVEGMVVVLDPQMRVVANGTNSDHRRPRFIGDDMLDLGSYVVYNEEGSGIEFTFGALSRDTGRWRTLRPASVTSFMPGYLD